MEREPQKISVEPEAWKKWLRKTVLGKDVIMAALKMMAETGQQPANLTELHKAACNYQQSLVEKWNDQLYKEYFDEI